MAGGDGDVQVAVVGGVVDAQVAVVARLDAVRDVAPEAQAHLERRAGDDAPGAGEVGVGVEVVGDFVALVEHADVGHAVEGEGADVVEVAAFEADDVGREVGGADLDEVDVEVVAVGLLAADGGVVVEA